jgi:hypothetical protein
VANYTTIVNRQALDTVTATLVDSLEAWAGVVLDEASRRAPDEPPLNEGLVREHGVAIWAAGKKVAGRGIKKPRSVSVPRRGIVMVAGFGFPARFNEIGTIHQPGRPFFTPAIHAHVNELPATVRSRFQFAERVHGQFREVIPEDA